MSPMTVGDEYDLVVTGVGTVGSAVALALARGAAAPRRMVLVDGADIKPESGITCPIYRGRSGPKARVLRDELLGSGRGIEVHARVQRVQDLEGEGLFRRETRAVVVMALDDHRARLHVVERIREFLKKRRVAGVLIVEAAVDRGLGQVAAYGTRHRDPCPACGLLVLPESEKCVAWSRGRLVRGTLRREAAAVAATAEKVVRGFLRSGPGSRWVNSQTIIELKRGKVSRRTWFQRRRVEGCFGPHFAAAPIDWGE
jgi:hypothetical protein